ncbi:hypothetical protein VB711_04790 [Cronbergia sp. UHCC 0137]|uniref:hypothetical protein n=1 Tax=Cronbergia sp. UHCC 0137 TaxID=3110239 RepID=UPI002B21FED4|nr:hypothetical protein [Cronbergia sp. UHCC 0137]MEA5617155.1 hypothetical protein [Cronbergia sp. UHCC 0137]
MIFSYKNLYALSALLFFAYPGTFEQRAIALPSLTQQQINPVFKPILPKLKQKSQIKLLLPKYIPESNTENPLYAIIETATKNKYEILLGFSPDCSGGTACRLGLLTAEKVNKQTPRLTGKAVLLAKGITGYFVDFQCGANCSDATLTWRYQGIQYTIGLKAGSRNELIKMANSAIK